MEQNNSTVTQPTQSCKHCKMQIPKGAKLCPYCKKKQKTPVIGIIILVLGVLMIIGACSSMVSDVPASQQNDSQSNADNGYATLEKFNSIKTGMTYEEVVAIMGSEGTVLSEASLVNTTTTIYYWYAKDGIFNMNVTVSDGKVIAKAQLGLN